MKHGDEGSRVLSDSHDTLLPHTARELERHTTPFWHLFTPVAESDPKSKSGRMIQLYLESN